MRQPLRDRAERMLRSGADALRVAGELGLSLDHVLRVRDEMRRAPGGSEALRARGEAMLRAGGAVKAVSRALRVDPGRVMRWKREMG